MDALIITFLILNLISIALMMMIMMMRKLGKQWQENVVRNLTHGR